MKKSALVLALALLVSACGAQPAAGPALFGDAQTLVRAATEQTGKAQTVRFSVAMTVADREATATGEMRFTEPGWAMKITHTADGVTSETRVVDGAQYVSIPEQARGLTGGKPWGRYPADSAKGKELGAMMRESGQSDPAQVLDDVRKGGTIDRSEQTTLDGRPVSHYWITVDLGKTSGLAEMAGRTAPMELWLDADQLPAQMLFDFSGLASEGDPPMGPMTMRYTGWGEPVDIAAPPADQVAELPAG